MPCGTHNHLAFHDMDRRDHLFPGHWAGHHKMLHYCLAKVLWTMPDEELHIVTVWLVRHLAKHTQFYNLLQKKCNFQKVAFLLRKSVLQLYSRCFALWHVITSRIFSGTPISSSHAQRSLQCVNTQSAKQHEWGCIAFVRHCWPLGLFITHGNCLLCLLLY